MRKLQVSLSWLDTHYVIGELHIYESRGQERYQFTYNQTWTQAKIGFAIDPALPLMADARYINHRLWGVFQDISPDRWGRLVQTRAHNRHLSESDFMLGVSDYMRMGALRLNQIESPEAFLADHHNVPKLVDLHALEQAISHLEAGQETAADLALLVQPGSSLGGAHPKAALEDKGHIWIAKFQSRFDTERVALWEATLLNMAQQAGIRTANYKLLNAKNEQPVLLVKRFDRQGKQRIPFMSAMTFLERDENNCSSASYIELSDALTRYSSQPRLDKLELWQRMVFNAMAGNIDDHLRNHGFLRDPQGWRLAPAYDINPTNETFERRSHQLSFDGSTSRPCLTTCIELGGFFGLTQEETKIALAKIGNALKNWQTTAKKHGLRGQELKRMENSFVHRDTEELMRYLT
ncbi:MAG: serine/threonine-protein kinase HipA [Glomeribacter sp. 1016415]|nr:serine/threonine-protein kinase HipA [Glomeribacter sp. 1016415]